MKIKSSSTLKALLLSSLLLSSVFVAPSASAQICNKCVECAPYRQDCSDLAVQTSKSNTGDSGGGKATIPFIKEEFVMQREWLIKELFENHILPALMLFAEQITAMAMQQVVVIGTFLDAKHQLETQRLFNEMTARAHKDYQPSEGMCTFGTNIRSLAASDRNMDLSAAAISARGLQRELLSGDGSSLSGATSDFSSRLKQFREVYCEPKDNNEGLKLLCPGPQDTKRANRDIDFTATFDAPLTLKLDFTSEGNKDHGSRGAVSPEEEDVFALASNLYAHDVAPLIPQAFLADENGNINSQATPHYMNIRALAAKRSVARNSFATIVAMKSQGEKEVQPYLYAIMKGMGLSDGAQGADDEIKKYLGERPSYHAQMEVLTKKLYQHPAFYTELYDKPANVERKNVSMQAIELMQKRDIYRSILRSEAILSVMLETALGEHQDKITNEMNRLTESDTPVKITE
jgi:hypothetical protein